MNVHVILLSFMIFQAAMNPSGGDPKKILHQAELKIDIVHPSTDKIITVEAVSIVWGHKSDGYPITHDFDYWQTYNVSFDLPHIDGGDSSYTESIGYGKYKITIDNDSIYVDYRDCEYPTEYNENGRDLLVRYNSTEGYFYVKSATGDSIYKPNGSTEHVWEHGRKSSHVAPDLLNTTPSSVGAAHSRMNRIEE